MLGMIDSHSFIHSFISPFDNRDSGVVEDTVIYYDGYKNVLSLLTLRLGGLGLGGWGPGKCR